MDEKKKMAMDFLCSFGDEEKITKKDKKSKKEKKDKVSKEGEDTAKADAPEDEVNSGLLGTPTRPPTLVFCCCCCNLTNLNSETSCVRNTHTQW